MSDRNASQVQATQLIDWLFSRLGGDDASPPPRAAGSAPSVVSEPSGEAQLPPTVEDSVDLQAAYEWLQRERRRLDGYTQAQLGRLRSEHQAMVQQNYENEAALIQRSQELSRQEELLVAQNRALQAQALEHSEREQGLAAQLEQWRVMQEEMTANQQLSAQVRQDAEAQVAALESLKSETNALRRAREAARADLETLAVALTEQREARAKEQAYFAARKAQLEERLEVADRAEAAARQRLAEVDELEARLIQEVEEEQSRLARERRELRARQASQREASPHLRKAQVSELRRVFGELQAELCQRSEAQEESER